MEIVLDRVVKNKGCLYWKFMVLVIKKLSVNLRYWRSANQGQYDTYMLADSVSIQVASGYSASYQNGNVQTSPGLMTE